MNIKEREQNRKERETNMKQQQGQRPS